MSAGAVTGTTAADGSFLLRDLPAGDVVVTLVPQQPLPPDLSAPVGTLRMPAGPIQVNQTTIVLSSEDLARYFQSDAGQSACPVADATAAPGLTGGGASSPGTGPCFQSTAAAPAGR